MNDLFPLRAHGAIVRRRGKVLVGPVDLTLEAKGLTIVIGPNGSGKTSLLKMLHGILRLNGGQVTWACPTDEARRRQAFVFQTPVMLRRSVLDNLIYPLRLSKVPKIDARMQAMDWVESLGLDEARNRPATVLSGGERQKLAIARALIRQPDLLFLDEPCASLDGQAMREIEGILKTASKGGTRIIMSTHDMGQAKRLASEVIFMLHGQVREYGSADRFFERPQTEQARAFLNGDIVD